MRYTTTMSAVSLALVLAIAGPQYVSACESAGAFKHVGVVTAVDLTALTVTIEDAESGEPVTFSATAQQLKDIKPGDQIMIGFLEKDGKLTAVRIQA
jgi:hypothetical protein